MKKQLLYLILIVWAFLLLTSTLPAFSQQKISSVDKIANFPFHFFEKLQKISGEIEKNLMERSSKALKKLARQEVRPKKKLTKKDSLARKQVFGNLEEEYQKLQAKLAKPDQMMNSGKEYLPHHDSLKTSLNFLSGNSNLLADGTEQSGKLKNTLININSLEGKLN